MAPELHPLRLGEGRDGLVSVPAGMAAGRPASLVLALHGAGGDARGAVAPLQPLADELGVILVAPESRGQTWDRVRGGFGPDVALIDTALASAFARLPVDPGRIAIEGFSDGASYALSLGLTNGDLFAHVIAFSPGFAAPGDPEGDPRCFVSHGTGDRVLPIDRCSRTIVPILERGGYEVRYVEFDGGHEVPGRIARQAVEGLLA